MCLFPPSSVMTARFDRLRLSIVSGLLTEAVLGVWLVFTGISEPRQWGKGSSKVGYRALGAIIIDLKSDFRKPMEDTLHKPPHIPGHKTFPSV